MKDIEHVMNYLILDKIINKSTPENIKELIAGLLARPQMEFLSHAIHNEGFEFLMKDSYFKTIYEPDQFGSADIDQLIDMGLYDNGYVYGQIINSDDYGLNFNPYHYRMNCNIFLITDYLKFTKIKSDIYTYKLTKIDKSEIKYFNYGKDITSTT
jgi:hypothetical protein